MSKGTNENHIYRHTEVFENGTSHSTELVGFYAEVAGDQLMRKSREDNRILFASLVVVIPPAKAHMPNQISVRSIYHQKQDESK